MSISERLSRYRPAPRPGDDHDAYDHEHRAVQSGSWRAAVFGMSDGLVSNAALILGVAGANSGPNVVRTAGVAGLVAGACSMAAGEWLSMRAQQDLLERELAVERASIRARPEYEQRELQDIYETRGIAPDTAREVAEAVMADEDVALEIHAREEIGIDPGELGNPLAAAVASFIAFALGAVLPLLPWLIGSGTAAAVASLVVAGVAAGLLGLVVALLSQSPWPGSVVRHVAVAAAATTATFAIGSLFDVQA
jgi:vacuolar iron transporter family protein